MLNYQEILWLAIMLLDTHVDIDTNKSEVTCSNVHNEPKMTHLIVNGVALNKVKYCRGIFEC